MTSALATTDDKREVALLKAVGLDRLAPEQRQLALNIASRYDLDLLLKHLVMIEGRPYITRDGLLHVAHRSGQFDGMTTTEPVLADGFWRATCSVYRKDMAHPFTYTGRYPEKGNNAKFAPEMAVKVAEVMAFRRAFDVAAPTAEERWDVEVDAPQAPPQPKSLAERVQERRAAVLPSEPEEEPSEPPTASEMESLNLVPPSEPPKILTLAELRRRADSANVSVKALGDARKRLFPDRMSDQLSPAELYALAEEIGVA